MAKQLLRFFTTRHQPNRPESDLLLINLRSFIQKNRFVRSLNITKTLIKTHKKSPFDILHSLSNSSPSLAPIAADVLVTACSKLRLPDDALCLIATLPRFPSILSLNRLLQSLVTARRYKEALFLFQRIISNDVNCANNSTYNKAIEAAVKSRDLDKGLELKEELEKRLGIQPADSFSYNMLISGMWNARRGDDAKKLFDEMLQKKVNPTRVTFNAMISGYCHTGDLEAVNEVLRLMRGHGVRPNVGTYHILRSGPLPVYVQINPPNVTTYDILTSKPLRFIWQVYERHSKE